MGAIFGVPGARAQMKPSVENQPHGAAGGKVTGGKAPVGEAGLSDVPSASAAGGHGKRRPLLVLLEMGGSPDAPPFEQEAAEDALRSAAERDGYRVLLRREVSERLPEALQTCRESDCASELAQALHAELVVGMYLWSKLGQTRTESVALRLVDVSSNTYSGESKVRHRDLRDATVAAWRTARSAQRLGPGPWLSVKGEPDGAEVRVDGKSVGRLPYFGRVALGTHRVSVGERWSETIHVDGETDETHVLTVSRQSAGQRAVLGPAVLGGAGVALAAVGTVGLLQGERCDVEVGAGRCLEGSESASGVSAAYLGVGAAAVVGAVLWHVMSGRSPRKKDRKPSVQVGPAYMGFAGRF